MIYASDTKFYIFQRILFSIFVFSDKAIGFSSPSSMVASNIHLVRWWICLR